MPTTLYDSAGRVANWASVTLVDTTATLIVPAVANMRIVVTGCNLSAAVATNIEFRSNANIILPGDGTVGGGIPFGGPGDTSPSNGPSGWLMATNAGEALYLKQSVACRVVGSLNYALVPT